MTPVEVLQAARDLISDPDHWCKYHNAITVRGYAVTADDPDAARWCMAGAVRKVAGSGSLAGEALIRLCNLLGRPAVVDFNDNHTHGEVLAAFDRAIEAAK